MELDGRVRGETRSRVRCGDTEVTGEVAESLQRPDEAKAEEHWKFN